MRPKLSLMEKRMKSYWASDLRHLYCTKRCSDFVAWQGYVHLQKMCLGCIVLQRCLSRAVGEVACCMLFRPSHIVRRSHPAVKTDTNIHMHPPSGWEMLIQTEDTWLFTVAHIQYASKRNKRRMYMNICVYLVSPCSVLIQIDLTWTKWILFCKHSHTQSTIFINKDSVRSHPALCVVASLPSLLCLVFLLSLSACNKYTITHSYFE